MMNSRESVPAERLEPLVDEHEFSRITGRSVASARRDRLLGQGCPYVKLGALVRYRLEDIRKFIQSNVHTGEQIGAWRNAR